MDEKLFSKIHRVLDEGGKLRIINRKGQELDITLEYKTAFDSIIEVEKTQLDAISELEGRNKQMIQELAHIKNQLNNLIEIRNIRDNYIIKKKLYEDSSEAKLIKRLSSKNIKDIGAVINSNNGSEYEDGITATQKEIYMEYEEGMTKELKKQMNSNYEKTKLDELAAQYEKKYKKRS